MTPRVNKEFNVLDIMKYVMAIIVVAIHTRPEYSFESETVRALFESVYSIAVPYFFIASGFLLFRKIIFPLNSEGEARILAYIKRIFKLYVIWTIIYLPFTFYGFYKDSVSPLKSIIIFIRNVAFVGENFMSWPLWYLLALIIAVCIIYVLMKYRFPMLWIVGLSILVAFIGYILDYCNENGIMQTITDLYYSIFLKTRNGFFVGFLYVSLGMFLAKTKKISLGAFACCLIIGLIGYAFHLPFFNVLVVLGLFGISVSIRLEKVNPRVSCRFRKMSTIIYFTHMIFVAPLLLWFGFTQGVSLFCVVITLVVALSLFLTQLHEGFLKLLFD